MSDNTIKVSLQNYSAREVREKLAAMRGVRTIGDADGKVLVLVKAVRAVEWVTRENGTQHHFCPECGNWEHYGHATDCELDAALAAFEVDADGEGE